MECTPREIPPSLEKHRKQDTAVTEDRLERSKCSGEVPEIHTTRTACCCAAGLSERPEELGNRGDRLVPQGIDHLSACSKSTASFQFERLLGDLRRHKRGMLVKVPPMPV